MSEYRITFGSKLNYYRTRENLSMRALAVLVNVDHSYIGHLEAGRKEPPIREIVMSFGVALRLNEGETNILLVSAGYAPRGMFEWTEELQLLMQCNAPSGS